MNAIALKGPISIRTKLLIALAGTSIVAIAVAAILMDRFTTGDFEAYVFDQQMQSHMDGMMGSESSGTMMGDAEKSFLSDVRQSLWISGGLTAVAALIVALFLSRQITRPLARLAVATKGIAGGNLSTRVDVRAGDEIGQVGEAFNSMAAALQHQEEVRQSMMADIAHELRTPLSVLRGNLEAMLDGLVEPDAEQIQMLHGQSLALARLVEDLRTLSLASAGQLALERRPVDLCTLSRETVAEMEAAAGEKGVHLRVAAPPDLPSIEGDRGRLAQVLRNLLDNALRYTPAGGTVTVEIGRGGSGSEATISVNDTGSGIAPEDLAHVFDRFYRADSSRSRETGGSGLGLAIARQLVEAHGGRMWAESGPGQGSRFTFALPLARG